MPGLMQRILPVFVLLGLWSGRLSANSQSGGSSASPTLQETTDWLKPHLVGVVHSIKKTIITFHAKKGKDAKEVDRQGINTYESVSAASFDGCALTLGQLTRGDDYSVVTISQIPLDHLIRASLKEEKHEPLKALNGDDSTETNWVPASEVAITLEASTSVITFKRKSTGNVPLEQDSIPFEGSSSSLVIRSDNTEIPPRLVKALNHAIELCHVNTKPEPF